MSGYLALKTDFDCLERTLNSIDSYFPDYCLYQILPEHCNSGTLFVIILKRNGR